MLLLLCDLTPSLREEGEGETPGTLLQPLLLLLLCYLTPNLREEGEGEIPGTLLQPLLPPHPKEGEGIAAADAAVVAAFLCSAAAGLSGFSAPVLQNSSLSRLT